MDNRPQKTYDLPCFIFIVIAIVLVIIYKAVEFFREPDAIYQIITFFEAIGLCIGSAILLFFCFYIFETISTEIKQRLIRESKEYPVRCYTIKMEKIGFRPILDSLPEESGQETKTSIYFNITLTNYGIYITTKPGTNTEEKISVDNAFQPSMFNRDWSNPIIILTSSINLYYIIYKLEGSLEYELGPTNLAGYTGESPNIPDGYQLEIVILFNNFMEENNKKKIETMEQPLKLKIIVLDDDGNNDTIATCELYKAIYGKIKSLPPDDDDSWMYHSRPMYW